MERLLVYRGTSFVWDEAKAAANARKHSVSFEKAVSVFDDPFLKLQDASQNHEKRDAAIGFDESGRLLTVVHIEFDGEHIRIISARRASASEELFYDQ